MPCPLKFTKPSCECSLFIAGVEEICQEVVYVNIWVVLVTLRADVCVSFSRSLFSS